MIGNTSELENAPDASWGILIAFGKNSLYCVQLYFCVLDTQNNIYVRTRRETGEWSSWYNIAV